ncbi:4-hydroxythreonine-4-phosphate dehydrogenase PdxA [Ghiorsea bivora]|uniref:4-hydroxythreonine-4-phosphate dehydrogenase PdxA n=1 Tax=Ghiorsea bivora TaxID=1485545 RepID=UPI00056DC385|nr:4-hydroxythreonine-4-phosphate dehydrogenase PdxA [Ghiorsea bivora]
MKPFVLTVGEPAGIGPDCVLLAFQAQPEIFRNIIVIAKRGWLTSRAKVLGLSMLILDCDASFERDVARDILWVYDPTDDGMRVVIAGKPSVEEAESVVCCIRIAAEMCISKQAAGLITAPIEKAVLKDAGFAFPGHTEFLADIAGVERVVMMLASQVVRIALLTTHVAIKAVPDLLNQADTITNIRITYQTMQQQMGIPKPRLALCGLNPHAGEQGHFGKEEIDILTPALNVLAEQGIVVDGPLPADTLFSADMRQHYDAIVCCYHDQGLIPIKALSFGDTVNVTLGLPFIRTSVDHGTALSRAGTGNISYTSLIAAIEMAQSQYRSIS